MGQVLHGSATTTAAVRRAIQRSEESVRALARHYAISPTTVQKWRKRTTVSDQPMGPAEPHSTVLSIEHEAMIVAFRRHSLLPLDDCLYALQPTIPGLMRSSLHRCLQRHGISRLPDMDGEAPARKKFKAYPIGFFHIDIAEARSGEGKLYMFAAIDRTSKFAIVRLYEQADRSTDVTESKLLDQHQSILLAELQHRVRNVMAIIRAVVSRTAATASDIADYEALITSRLMAMARAQTLLTRTDNVGVDLGTLVRDELEAQAHHKGQYVLSGPEVVLSPKAAEALSLAIHELATNALKYGALSGLDGEVEVTWQVLQPYGLPLLRLDWTERRPAPPDWSPVLRSMWRMCCAPPEHHLSLRTATTGQPCRKRTLRSCGYKNPSHCAISSAPSRTLRRQIEQRRPHKRMESGAVRPDTLPISPIKARTEKLP